MITDPLKYLKEVATFRMGCSASVFGCEGQVSTFDHIGYLCFKYVNIMQAYEWALSVSLQWSSVYFELKFLFSIHQFFLYQQELPCVLLPFGGSKWWGEKSLPPAETRRVSLPQPGEAWPVFLSSPQSVLLTDQEHYPFFFFLCEKQCSCISTKVESTQTYTVLIYYTKYYTCMYKTKQSRFLYFFIHRSTKLIYFPYVCHSPAHTLWSFSHKEHDDSPCCRVPLLPWW